MAENDSDDIGQATVAEFLRRLDRGRAALDAVLAPCTAQQLAALDPEGGWSMNDHLAHLAVWANGMTALLRHEGRYAAMGVTAAEASSTDDLNELLYRRHRDRPPDEVRAFFDAAHHRLRAAVAALDDTDLQRPYSFYQPDAGGEDGDTPIVAYLVGNSFGHYEEHIPWIKETLARIGTSNAL